MHMELDYMGYPAIEALQDNSTTVISVTFYEEHQAISDASS